MSPSEIEDLKQHLEEFENDLWDVVVEDLINDQLDLDRVQIVIKFTRDLREMKKNITTTLKEFCKYPPNKVFI